MGESKMECNEIVEWAKRHDIEEYYWIRKEKKIGDKLRGSQELTKSDLIEIIEWKFESDARLKTVELNHVKNINERVLKEVSKVVFNLNTSQDLERIEQLCAFRGIGPSVASTVLAFFDPKNYGVFDYHVWQEVFGEELKKRTVKNYVKLLSKLREIASRCGFEVRTVEKAFYAKNCAGAKQKRKT